MFLFNFLMKVAPQTFRTITFCPGCGWTGVVMMKSHFKDGPVFYGTCPSCHAVVGNSSGIIYMKNSVKIPKASPQGASGESLSLATA